MKQKGYGNAAFMAQRKRPKESIDDFPTPAWAIRAFFSHCNHLDSFTERGHEVLEPCCNRGYMEREVRRLLPNANVVGFDKYEYPRLDGLPKYEPKDFIYDKVEPVDTIITNPPFNLAGFFITKALQLARTNVVILARIQLLEGRRRFEGFMRDNPPTYVMPFVERVTMFEGRVSSENASATMFCWYHWHLPLKGQPPTIKFIPPCKTELEQQGDYDSPCS